MLISGSGGKDNTRGLTAKTIFMSSSPVYDDMMRSEANRNRYHHLSGYAYAKIMPTHLIHEKKTMIIINQDFGGMWAPDVPLFSCFLFLPRGK